MLYLIKSEYTQLLRKDLTSLLYFSYLSSLLDSDSFQKREHKAAYLSSNLENSHVNLKIKNGPHTQIIITIICSCMNRKLLNGRNPTKIASEILQKPQIHEIF